MRDVYGGTRESSKSTYAPYVMHVITAGGTLQIERARRFVAHCREKYIYPNRITFSEKRATSFCPARAPVIYPTTPYETSTSDNSWQSVLSVFFIFLSSYHSLTLPLSQGLAFRKVRYDFPDRRKYDWFNQDSDVGEKSSRGALEVNFSRFIRLISHAARAAKLRKFSQANFQFMKFGKERDCARARFGQSKNYPQWLFIIFWLWNFVCNANCRQRRRETERERIINVKLDAVNILNGQRILIMG